MPDRTKLFWKALLALPNWAETELKQGRKSVGRNSQFLLDWIFSLLPHTQITGQERGEQVPLDLIAMPQSLLTNHLLLQGDVAFNLFRHHKADILTH